MLDRIDKKILREVAKEENAGASIKEIVKPLLKEKSYRALRLRVHDLEHQGLVKLERQRDKILVEITKKGLEQAQSLSIKRRSEPNEC